MKSLSSEVDGSPVVLHRLQVLRVGRNFVFVFSGQSVETPVHHGIETLTRIFITSLDSNAVRSIVGRFQAHNPYDQTQVPGSILKIEDINHDPATGEPRNLYAYSIASKRYALLTREPDGTYRLARQRDATGELVAKRSEHGLGHLTPPSENWEDELWEWIINTDVGHNWPVPEWVDQPTLGRTTINTPHDLRLFREFNASRPYRDQIRPGGFLTIAHPHPIEQRGLLLAPFTSDPEEAMSRRDWVDRSSRETGLEIRTDDPEYAIHGIVAVLDYRHYVQQYMTHREWKASSADPGQIGRLLHRQVLATGAVRIGKEVVVLDVEQPVDTRLMRCRECGSELGGRQSRWCSERCRSRSRRSAPK